MKTIRNTSNGARGAYLKDGKLVMVEAGETAEGDFVDVNDEWFDAADPLDHDGDGKKGGSKPRKTAEADTE